MNCTFYRPETKNCEEYDNIMGKLYLDFLELKAKTNEDYIVHSYLFRLSREARPFYRCPGMNFFGLVEPDQVPGDIRVIYFYFPTYIAGAIMIQAVLQFPELLQNPGFSDTCSLFKGADLKELMHSTLLGCTGRGFNGDSYDSDFNFFDCMRLFVSAGAEEFIKQYPQLCPEFTELFSKRLPEYRKYEKEARKGLHWNALDIDR